MFKKSIFFVLCCTCTLACSMVDSSCEQAQQDALERMGISKGFNFFIAYKDHKIPIKREAFMLFGYFMNLASMFDQEKQQTQDIVVPWIFDTLRARVEREITLDDITLLIRFAEGAVCASALNHHQACCMLTLARMTSAEPFDAGTCSSQGEREDFKPARNLVDELRAELCDRLEKAHDTDYEELLSGHGLLWEVTNNISPHCAQEFFSEIIWSRPLLTLPGAVGKVLNEDCLAVERTLNGNVSTAIIDVTTGRMKCDWQEGFFRALLDNGYVVFERTHNREKHVAFVDLRTGRGGKHLVCGEFRHKLAGDRIVVEREIKPDVLGRARTASNTSDQESETGFFSWIIHVPSGRVVGDKIRGQVVAVEGENHIVVSTENRSVYSTHIVNVDTNERIGESVPARFYIKLKDGSIIANRYHDAFFVVNAQTGDRININGRFKAELDNGRLVVETFYPGKGWSTSVVDRQSGMRLGDEIFGTFRSQWGSDRMIIVAPDEHSPDLLTKIVCAHKPERVVKVFRGNFQGIIDDHHIALGKVIERKIFTEIIHVPSGVRVGDVYEGSFNQSMGQRSIALEVCRDGESKTNIVDFKGGIVNTLQGGLRACLSDACVVMGENFPFHRCTIRNAQPGAHHAYRRRPGYFHGCVPHGMFEIDQQLYAKPLPFAQHTLFAALFAYRTKSVLKKVLGVLPHPASIMSNKTLLSLFTSLPMPALRLLKKNGEEIVSCAVQRLRTQLERALCDQDTEDNDDKPNVGEQLQDYRKLIQLVEPKKREKHEKLAAAVQEKCINRCERTQCAHVSLKGIMAQSI